MQVVVMTAISGSGKTTLVKETYPDHLTCSADSFFYGKDGSYRFDLNLLGEAHDQCLAKFIRLLQDPEVKGVVVDNTGLSWQEVLHYFQVAKALRPTCEMVWHVIEPWDDREAVKCSSRNQHGVPPEKGAFQYGRLRDMLADETKGFQGHLLKSGRLKKVVTHPKF